MLMDEPFGAIDPITRARLQYEFLGLQEKVRKTVVFVTHDIDEAIRMGGRIAILKQGGMLGSTTRPSRSCCIRPTLTLLQWALTPRGLRVGWTRARRRAPAPGLA